MMRTALLLSLSVATGCATAARFERANVAELAKTQMVGMKKAELFACAGVPERAAEADGLEFLTYTGGGDQVSAAYAPTRRTAFSRTDQRSCEATFTLKDGAVQVVVYKGRTGGWATEGEQCAFVVQNCVRRESTSAPPPTAAPAAAGGELETPAR